MSSGPGNPSTGPSLGDLGPRFAEFVSRLERPIVFFDTETTGTDPLSDRVIEITLLRVSPLPVGVEPPRTWRLNPGARIPIESTRVHGIANDDVEQEPTFADVAAEIYAIVEGADIAGFNVGRFDARVLQNELIRAGYQYELSAIQIVDTQVIFHQREPRHLAAALQFYRGKELVDAHGAEADTIATLEVFAGQLERYPDLATSVEALHVVSNANNEAFCDRARRFSWRDDEPVFNFGKLKGKSLRWAASDPKERDYLRWILDGNFEDDTKIIVREALEGKIRRRALPA